MSFISKHLYMQFNLNTLSVYEVIWYICNLWYEKCNTIIYIINNKYNLINTNEK